MNQFTDQVVIVTGAAGGLGRAVCEYFFSRGAKVAYIDYSLDLLQKTFPDCQDNPKKLYLATDLTDRQDCWESIQHVIKCWGRIDVLANIAGGFIMGEAVHETTDKTWDFLFDLNARSILHTSAATVPVMLQQGLGKIINVSAGAAQKGLAQMGAYIASKSAVLRLTESMAMELREKHINVNCILPAIIDTERNRQDMPKEDHSRWVKPAKIAQIIGFLASDAADAIHGAGIPVIGLN